jgi:hypothetical protein
MLHDQASAFGQRVFTSAFLTRSIQSGSQAPSAIFRVSDFSGFAEDSQVTVEWFVPAAPKAPPKWDGTDVWAIAPGTADATDAGGVMSQYIDRGAYVTGYRLVAHFPQGTPVVISSAPVATVSAVFSANLGQSVAGRWEMHDGIIAGRARTTEVFRDVPQLSASFAGTTTAICKDTPTVYANTKKWICAHADLLLGSGPSCDGLSYGVQFDTRSGQIGALSAPTAPVAFCKPGQDPADDSCEAPR